MIFVVVVVAVVGVIVEIALVETAEMLAESLSDYLGFAVNRRESKRPGLVHIHSTYPKSKNKNLLRNIFVKFSSKSNSPFES